MSIKMGILVGAVALVAAQASPAAAADSNWSRHVGKTISAKQLGLPADAGPVRLGRAAIERKIGGRLGKLDAVARLSSKPPGGRRITTVRFRQSLDGRRVLWSQLNALVAGSKVMSISGTMVPLKSTDVTGTRRITAAQARRIARGTVAGATRLRPAEFVVFAGDPDKPRQPRNAYVVEVTTPEAGADDTPTVCVVVDAETGKVLKKWRGSAALIGSEPREKELAQAKNVLVQVADNKSTNIDLANDGVNFFTTGNPFSWGTGSATRERELFGSPSSAFLALPGQPFGQIGSVTQHFCLKRKYCGRDSGLPGPVGGGTVNRWFFSARFAGCRKNICNTSHYDSGLDRVFLTVADSDDADTIAHEVGHVIDEHFQDDYVDNFEGSEVSEALGEMFSYDYSFKTRFGTGVAVGDLLASPNSFTFPKDGQIPQKMSQFKCNAQDEHTNGYILAHAYWKWIEEMNAHGVAGRNVAGNLLQGIPFQLAAARTFGDTRAAFLNVIKASFGTDSPVFDAYITGFGTETNILFKHSRTQLGCTKK
ncbi:MAG TPA: PepSY domain-containing protein [Solirubrobacteraceae bacterium]|nr:PepSY domain-containing protein [Solirubrobacteraceae bacterium]